MTFGASDDLVANEFQSNELPNKVQIVEEHHISGRAECQTDR